MPQDARPTRSRGGRQIPRFPEYRLQSQEGECDGFLGFALEKDLLEANHRPRSHAGGKSFDQGRILRSAARNHDLSSRILVFAPPLDRPRDRFGRERRRRRHGVVVRSPALTHAGEQPFRVLERFEGADYPEGEVEPITPEDETDEEDPEAADMARQAFVELVQRVAGEQSEEPDVETEDSYGIASRVELPVETKQALLEQRSEPARMRMLGNALRALVAAVARSNEIAERARMNGKVIVG